MYPCDIATLVGSGTAPYPWCVAARASIAF